MLRIFSALFVLLVSLGNSAADEGRTLVFKEQNFQCSIPSTWTLESKPGFLVAAKRPVDGIFFVVAKPTNVQRVDVPSFMLAAKAKLISDGSEIVNEDTAPFEGYPAYSFTTRKMINNKLIYSHSISFIVGKIRYNLVMAQKDSDPSSGADFQAELASFRILAP